VLFHIRTRYFSKQPCTFLSLQTVILRWLVCQMRPIRAQIAQPYLICLIYKHPAVPVRSLAFPQPPHSTLGPAKQRHRPVSLPATSTTAPSLMGTSTPAACSPESLANLRGRTMEVPPRMLVKPPRLRQPTCVREAFSEVSMHF
jgi:hypothetical protein